MGTILAYNGKLKDIPKKWHLCDGTEGTPNLLDGRFLEGSTTIGVFKEAGLPNIWGNIYCVAYAGSGPFYNFGDSTLGPNSDIVPLNSRTVMERTVTFDASYSNIIYGKSNTVQPRSYIVYYIMKIQK